jgi:hypothetical protein
MLEAKLVKGQQAAFPETGNNEAYMIKPNGKKIRPKAAYMFVFLMQL